jgi:FlaA1/EpsC-like NDP-sugar epimerase
VKYLVTGALGSVGQALLPRLDGKVVATDVLELDVTDRREVLRVIRHHRPAVVYHLAGAKHAPEGELDPADVADVNINGTINVLAAAGLVNAKTIVTSTCKACDPETAYGASKLIAERATLNASGVVVRFHNVPESSGNVFRLWESIPESDPLPVTDCWRYFTPLEKAVDLLVAAADLPSGRYAWNPGTEPRWMPDVAADLYPGRAQIMIPPRRGDRAREPLMAACELVEFQGDRLHIVGAHDPMLDRTLTKAA